MNLRPDGPKPPALPTALHPGIHFSVSAVVVKDVVKRRFSGIVRKEKSAETPVFSRIAGISDFARMPGVLHAPKAGALPTALHPDNGRYYTVKMAQIQE